MNRSEDMLNPDSKRAADIKGHEDRQKDGMTDVDALLCEAKELREALVAMERERDLLAARMLLYTELVETSSAVMSHLSEKHRDERNGPGHSHSKPGVWDEDNGAGKANTPCQWCSTWPKFKYAVSIGHAMTSKDAARWMHYVDRSVRNLASASESVEKKDTRLNASCDGTQPNAEAFAGDFQPGFLEMRRIITQSVAISEKVEQIKEMLKVDPRAKQHMLLDQISDFSSTIIAMATIVQPPALSRSVAA